MTETEKRPSSDDEPDASADFLRELATSAPPKSVETMKAASDLVDREARIKRRAYEMWDHDGRPDGKHHDYWINAEAELSDGGG